MNLNRTPSKISRNSGPFTQAERKQKLMNVHECSDEVGLNTETFWGL